MADRRRVRGALWRELKETYGVERLALSELTHRSRVDQLQTFKDNMAAFAIRDLTGKTRVRITGDLENNREFERAIADKFDAEGLYDVTYARHEEGATHHRTIFGLRGDEISERIAEDLLPNAQDARGGSLAADGPIDFDVVPHIDEPVELEPLSDGDMNCVLYGVLLKRGEYRQKLYDEFPQLFEPGSINIEGILRLAMKSRTEINFYSEIYEYDSAVEPWMSFNKDSHCKKIDFVVVTGSHCRLAVSTKVDEVRYVENLRKNYREHSKGMELIRGEIEKGYRIYVSHEEGSKIIMLKDESCRPSQFVDIKDVDQHKAFYYCCDRDSTLAKAFKGIYKPTASTYMGKTVLKSEKFPCNTLMQKYQDIETVTYDHNRSFCAYASNPYYKGFPVSRFISVKGDVQESGDLKRGWVVLSSFKWTDKQAKKVFYSTLSGRSKMLYLTDIMYEYLKPYATMVIDHSILAIFDDINVIDFVNRSKYYRERVGTDLSKEKKASANTIIGSLIAGGVSQVMKRTIICDGMAFTKAIQDLQRLKISYYFEPIGNAGAMIIYFSPKLERSSGLFNLHSYILDYSSTQTMAKYLEVYAKGYDVMAVCSDSIKVTYASWVDPAREPLKVGTEVGEWKAEQVRFSPFYAAYKVRNYNAIKDEHQKEHKAKTVFDELPYAGSRCYISGPGGVGKSYPIVTKANEDLIYLVPTHALRKEFESINENLRVVTIAKYVSRASKQNRLKGSLVCVDEIFMLTYEELSTLLKYLTDKVVYLIGDDKQICTERVIDGVKSHKLENKHLIKFTRYEITRGPFSRHGREFGDVLDSLRPLTGRQQIQVLNSALPEVTKADIEASDIVIVSTHKEAKEMNDEYVKKFGIDTLPIRLTKPTKRPDFGTMSTYSEVATGSVWMDRVRMNDVIPEECRWEAAYGRTVDSLQGSTIEGRRVVVSAMLWKREGALYTAVTRAREFGQLRIIKI